MQCFLGAGLNLKPPLDISHWRNSSPLKTLAQVCQLALPIEQAPRHTLCELKKEKLIHVEYVCLDQWYIFFFL